MAFISSPVTGAAITGLTSPTYTLTVDSPPSPQAKQFAVTALGGTQTGVSIHSPTSPFILVLTRPTAFKSLSLVNPVTGQLTSVPRNNWKLMIVKGAVPLAGQSPANIVFRGEFAIPAGVEITSPAEIKAVLSLLGGACWNGGNDLVTSFLTGVL